MWKGWQGRWKCVLFQLVLGAGVGCLPLASEPAWGQPWAGVVLHHHGPITSCGFHLRPPPHQDLEKLHDWVFNGMKDARDWSTHDLRKLIDNAWRDSVQWRRKDPETVYMESGALGLVRWNESYRLFGFAPPGLPEELERDFWNECRTALEKNPTPRFPW